MVRKTVASASETFMASIIPITTAIAPTAGATHRSPNLAFPPLDRIVNSAIAATAPRTSVRTPSPSTPDFEKLRNVTHGPRLPTIIPKHASRAATIFGM